MRRCNCAITVHTILGKNIRHIIQLKILRKTFLILDHERRWFYPHAA
jgi:hypothetical protein